MLSIGNGIAQWIVRNLRKIVVFPLRQKLFAQSMQEMALKLFYYGVLREIILLDFSTFRVPLFKCDWVSCGSDVRVEDGFTLVNLHPRVNKFGRDPFILASQAT
ncbi:hypothetical protein ACOSQ4_009792 [Xanthoceras sorbifolium]